MAVDQSSNWDNVGTEPPVGEAIYFVSEQPFADYDNYFNYSVAKDIENIIAEFSYFFKKDGSVAMTGDLDMNWHAIASPNPIYCKVDNLFLKLQGGLSAYSPSVELRGKDIGSNEGCINFFVTGAGKTSLKSAGVFEGVTDTPYLLLYHGLKADIVAEKSPESGVLVDECLIKNGKAADSDMVDGKHASELQFAQNEEISLGTIPFSIYAPQSVLGTTHTKLELTNGSTDLDFCFQYTPAAPSGFSLKGRLWSILRRSSYIGYIELYNETDGVQVIEKSTSYGQYGAIKSSLFTIPAYDKKLVIRIWNSNGSGTTYCTGAWVEFIALKD